MTSPDHPDRDQEWDREERDESPLKRLDRNWSDLLQELRVVQTGVQLLTGFLLTLPFQARFAQLDRGQVTIYLCTVVASIIATTVLIAPVMLHRLLFRRHARKLMVTLSHRLAITGTAFLGLAILGVVLLIFDLLRGPVAGTVATVLVGLLLLTAWAALPLSRRGDADAADGD
ncbi:DUF6328 family protein [Nakamurella endophytica]|uniref:Sodium:proton antiporter n=1 Tax=Nakamurella endophytica TaxID=1748367 RepID=A0A917SUT0_9ACTN|nr:DUF6328 family protein [Nakamurella endophytica]GGL97238.1 hypothetical protein GCM10011594_16180 [Nakamurella endophytica]